MAAIRWPYQGFSSWPENYRAAVSITWDVDDEAPFYSRAGEKKEASEVEQRRYGMRRGLPLIVKMLQDTGIPSTFYIPAYIARQWPDVVRDLHAADYEIGGHGFLHEPVGGLDRLREEGIVHRSLDELQELTDGRVRGYRTPSWHFNHWTAEVLHDAGILYDSSLMGDIAPYGVAVGEDKRLIEIPIHWYWDDVEYWGHTQVTRNHTISPPSNAYEIWKAELDGVIAEGGSFVLTLHPHVSGRPGMLAAVRQLIEYVKSVPGIWVTTPGAMAEHVQSRPDVPTIELMPTTPDPHYDDSH